MTPWIICGVLAWALSGVLLVALASMIGPRPKPADPFTALACVINFAMLGPLAWPIGVGVLWWENRTGKINETETKP